VAVAVDAHSLEEILPAQELEVLRFAALGLAVAALGVLTEMAVWVGLEMAAAEEVVVAVRETRAAAEAVDQRVNIPRGNLLMCKAVELLSRMRLRLLGGVGFATLSVGDKDRVVTEAEDQVKDEVEELGAGEVDEADPLVDAPATAAGVPDDRGNLTVRDVGK
jgi:hypothetical protein